MSVIRTLLVVLTLNFAYAFTFFAVLSEAIDTAMLYKLLPFDAFPTHTMLAIITLTAIALVVATLTIAILFRIESVRDQLIPVTLPRAILLGLVAFGFILTLAFGSPAVEATEHQNVMSAHKYVLETKPERVGERHPFIRTYVTIPLSPCVLISYREAAWSGTGAYGGFFVDVWYGNGTKTTWSHVIWGS